MGQTITLDGQPYEVLGVLPASFTHRRADLFVPLQRKLDPATRGNHFLVTYARLKPGVSVERAAADMRALGQTLAREFGNNHGIDVRSYYEAVVGNLRTPLKVLLGAVFCVLLIACANVANLLLASGLARRRELAIRLALGARQGDLVRQLTTESVLLALTGGAFGVLLASWVVAHVHRARGHAAAARHHDHHRRPRAALRGGGVDRRRPRLWCVRRSCCSGPTRSLRRCAKPTRAPAASPASAPATRSSSPRLR